MGEIRLSCYAAPWGVQGHVQAVSDIANCGFDGLEFPSDVVQRYEDRLHVFEEILDTTGLRLSGLIQRIDFTDKDKADEQVELAANSARFVGTIGRGNLVVCQSRPIDFPLSDDDWTTAAAIAEEIGSRCHDFKVTLCFMPRARYFGDSEMDLKRFLAMTNPDLVRLALDSAELTLAGMNPAKTMATHADRIRTVRLRDVSGSRRKAETTGSRPRNTPQFGRGAVNFEIMAKAMLDAGYEGWVVVDVMGEAAQPKEAADAAYRFIKRRSGLFPY
ncbi:MAG: sugar phosphate isomerase/epimerase [Planctomycetota bacterium]|nr:sugar phosphate isomerase/epimerase [Planctomycetota bacterium]